MYWYILVCTAMYWCISLIFTMLFCFWRFVVCAVPHKFSKHKGSGFSMGSADSAAADGRRGCNVYEVNTWLWNFGRGKPRLGGLTVEETTVRKKTVRKDQAKCSAETRRRWREDGAWWNEVCSVLEVYTSTYQYIPVCTSMCLYLTKLVQFWNSTSSHCIPCIGDV